SESRGGTVCALVTGERREEGVTGIAAILMSQPDPLKSIASMNPEVPAPVAQVIEKAMAAHPDQRYGSAAAMRQALRSVASSAPPASLHRAQTLTDEPVKVNAAAVERSANRPLPTPPVVRPEAPQAAAQPGESQITDHIIVLLDKVGQSLSGKNSQGRDSRRKDAPPKAAPAPAPVVQERTPPAPPVQAMDSQEK